MDVNWRDDARCAQITSDVDFFPEVGQSWAQARAVCRTCEVREQCLRFALENDTRYGVWGGVRFRSDGKPGKRRGAA